MSYSTIAWIILIGSILFLAAAFNPSSMAFGARTPAARLEIIHKYEGLWVFSQYLFAGGAILAALGYVLFARNIAAESALGNWLTLASGGMLAGALLWGINLYQRARDFEGFANGTQPNWPFVAYTLLTMLGLAVWGWVYLQGGFPVWLGWATLIPAVVLFGLFITFRDMPPFVYYLLNLLAVWVLFRNPPS